MKKDKEKYDFLSKEKVSNNYSHSFKAFAN